MKDNLNYMHEETNSFKYVEYVRLSLLIYLRLFVKKTAVVVCLESILFVVQYIYIYIRQFVVFTLRTLLLLPILFHASLLFSISSLYF